MATRMDGPAGMGLEAGDRAAEEDESSPEPRGRSGESEESVHLERATTSLSGGVQGRTLEEAAVRPRWSPARALPESSDLIVDASHLKVDELSLELQAQVGIQHLRVETKGLEAELLVKADLGNVVRLSGPGRAGQSRAKLRAPVRRAGKSAGMALAGLAAGALAQRARSRQGGAVSRTFDRARGRGRLESLIRRAI